MSRVLISLVANQVNQAREVLSSELQRTQQQILEHHALARATLAPWLVRYPLTPIRDLGLFSSPASFRLSTLFSSALRGT